MITAVFVLWQIIAVFIANFNKKVMKHPFHLW